MNRQNDNFYVLGQKHVDAKRLRPDGLPWTSTTEVLSSITTGDRVVSQVFYIVDKLWWFKDGIHDYNLVEFFQQPVVEFEYLEEIKYNELVLRVDNRELIPGKQYRITDFYTTVNNFIDYAKSDEHAFDVIVTADSNRTLNENARAIRNRDDSYFPDNVKFESWELKYSIFNDIKLYDWADKVNGKGVIYFMRDEHRNECGYDFKSILFKRFRVTDNSINHLYSDYNGQFLGVSEGFINLTNNESDFIYLYTFSNYHTSKDLSIQGNLLGSTDDMVNNYNSFNTSQCANNIINSTTIHLIIDDVVFKTQELNNIVFIDSLNNELIPQLSSNYIGSGSYSMTLINSESNKFGERCSNNILLGVFNTFGNEINGNNFGIYTDYNSFGNGIRGNSFGSAIQVNSFGNSINSNSFGYDVYGNSFGNEINGNSFGNVVHRNSFGNEILANSFGNTIQANSFGNVIDGNSFGNTIQANSFGNKISSNSFGDGIRNNSFGNEIHTNSFGNTIQANSFGNEIRSNSFGNEINSNSFGNSITVNSFVNIIETNSFGNDIYGNSFGNNVYGNSFGNNIKYLVIGDEYVSKLIINDGVMAVNNNTLDIDDLLSSFINIPKQVTIMKGYDEYEYVAESVISSTFTERINYAI